MPSFTRESGGTLHVAVMGVNRIGKVQTTGEVANDVLEAAGALGNHSEALRGQVEEFLGGIKAA